MKLKHLFLGLAAFVLTLSIGASGTFAQTAQPVAKAGDALPGVFWLSLGDQTPTEHSNIQLNTYAEQGIEVYRRGFLSFVPFVSFGVNADTVGFDWNNSIKASGGIKANIAVPHGTISLGSAYALEDRFRTGNFKTSPQFFISDWFGWQNPATSRFPGSTWATLGNVSPVERNNLIFNSYVQQGVVLTRIGKLAIVPFAVGTFGKDQNGYDWNNYIRPGVGIDFILPQGIELESLYLNEIRPGTNLTTGAFSLSLKFWHGWTKGGKR